MTGASDIVQLGKALQALRVESGMTGEALSRLAGVDPAHVNRAENHGRNFSWETLKRLVDALGVPMSRLTSTAEEIAKAERERVSSPSDDQKP